MPFTVEELTGVRGFCGVSAMDKFDTPVEVAADVLFLKAMWAFWLLLCCSRTFADCDSKLNGGGESGMADGECSHHNCVG